MARFNIAKTVVFAFAFALTCVVIVHPQFADDVPNTETEDSLNARVATLEKALANLQQQIQNDKIASSLAGFYWVEESRFLAGKREKQTDEVAWRLATDASSDRHVLGAEVHTYRYGPFSIDASRDAVWIDFKVRRSETSYTVKGIVQTSFGRCNIAIPGKLFDGDTFLNPARPTSFESTTSNEYDVYTLIRERYGKTGVWR